MNTITLTSKGQVTLPATTRKRMGLQKGDRLQTTVTEQNDAIIIRKISSIEELSDRANSYNTKKPSPIMDVSDYYSKHRNIT